MTKLSQRLFFGDNKALLLFFAVAAFLMLCLNVYLVVNAPEDYLQGIYAKIMYIHVPCAWLSLFFYTLIAVLSLAFLVWRAPVYDMAAAALAPVGIVLTVIALITGSIWGKPTWGAWWVWDARLTSMLVLLFIYLGYFGLRNSGINSMRLAKVSAIFAIIGFINIPIIKFSVNLWNTLHQPSSVFRLGGSSIHPSMFWPLILCAINLLLFSCVVFLLSIKIIFYRKKLERLKYHK